MRCYKCDRRAVYCLCEAEENAAALVFGIVVVAVIALALLLSGCGAGTKETRIYLDASDVALKGWAPILSRQCVEPLKAALVEVRAMPLGPAREIRARSLRVALQSKCGAAVQVYTRTRTAIEAGYTVADTVDAGECVGVSSAVQECNLKGVRARVSALIVELTDAVARVKKEGE